MEHTRGTFAGGSARWLVVGIAVLVFAAPAAAAQPVSFLGVGRALISDPVGFVGEPELIWLLETSQATYVLEFAEPVQENLVGLQLEVRGTLTDGVIAVDSIQVLDAAPPPAVPKPTTHQTGTQNTVAFLLKFSDVATEQ